MIPQHKSFIKTLWHSEAYRALRELAGEMVTNWAKQSPSKDNEFQFVYESAEREGKIIGVDAFLKEIENIASSK